MLKRRSKPQTDLTPSTFLLPVKFCAKEMTIPIFHVLPSLSGWQNGEIRGAVPASFSLIISLFSSPGLDRSQGRFPWVTSELSTCDCWGMDGCGQECVSAQVLKELCCSRSDFWQLDSVLGVGLYGYLCHCNDFTSNCDIFIKCVNKYIKIGTKECLSLDIWWWEILYIGLVSS